jgi:Restriction endonuclease
MDLLSSLQRATGTPEKMSAVLQSTAEELGVSPTSLSPTLVALALCRVGVTPEKISRHLDWLEFESFCGGLLKASGYRVRENVVLRRPRAQVDLVAFGPSLVLSIDCKHWKREHSPSALRDLAAKQLKRSRLFRKKHQGVQPIVSVILSFSAPQGTFVDGVAVVPLRTLRSFLGSVESYAEFLRFA